MKITYSNQTGRFLADAKYHEKDTLKSAGFYWDPDKRQWWTKDKNAALKLRRHFDAAAIEATKEKLAHEEKTASISSATEPEGGFKAPAPFGKNFFPYQHAGIQFALGRKNTLIGDEMGVGKEQSVDSPVLTPTGWKRIGDMKVGSLIMGGSSGKVQKVLGVFPQGVKDLYEVKFNDGTSTLAGLEHLWHVRDDNDYRRRPEHWRLMNTQQILEAGLTRGTQIRWEIPLAPPVQFEFKEFAVHPYLLGVLLGNGGLTSTTKISTTHKEQLQLIQPLLPSGVFIEGPPPSDPNVYFLTTKKQGTVKNPLTEALREIGVWGKRDFEKEIPEQYMMGSIHQRLQLLQGLMDTDGGIYDDRRRFSSCSKNLADGVATLVRSLGGWASVNEAPPQLPRGKRNIYTVSINLPGLNVFRLQYHIDRDTLIPGKRPRKSIVSIEKVKTGEAVCIKVDDPEHRYITDDYIVTHNTCQAIGVINCMPEAQSVLVICPASLKLNWLNELQSWLVNDCRVTVLYSNGKHREWGSPEAKCRIYVINYDIVEKFDLKSSEWDLLIIDECFPAGTKIKTPHGLKNIEDLKIGDTVCNAVGTGTITATGKQYAKVITLKTDAGEIPVTPHHPFLTDTGWDFAKDLTGKTLKTQGDCLRVLRGDVSKQTLADQVLREVLLCEVEDATAGSYSEGSLEGSPVQDCGEATLNPEAGGCYGTSSIQADDNQQPNEKPGDEGEGFGRSGGKDPVSPQGQRVGSNGSGEADHGFVPGLGMESPRQDKCEKGECGELPYMLQGGLGGCAEEVGRRSERGESCTSDSTGSGSEEDFEAGRVRVEGIVDHEQASDGDDSGGVEVYNLSVSGHPSYTLVIGGKEIIVHNCHYLKNGTSKRRREIWGGREQKPGKEVRTWKAIPAKRTLALTGTPVCNRPSELWTMLRALDPDNWPSTSWQKFHVRYCAAVKGRFGWVTDGASNLDELNQKLRSTIMIRREKVDVLKDLPPKTRKTTTLEATEEMKILLSKEAALQAIQDAGGLKKACPKDIAMVQDWLDDNGGETPSVVGQLAKIRRMVGEIKAPQAAEYAKELMENGLECLVIFAHHKDVVRKLEEELKEYGVVKIVGDTSPDDRQKAVEDFQAGRAKIFIGSITAAGVGITLTRATHTLFVEVDWVPGNLQQAEDRTHRHGQRGNVVIEYLIYEGSIDTIMIDTVESKKTVIGEIVK